MIVFIAMIVFLACSALLFVRVVPQYTAAIIVRMGEPVRTIRSGPHFILWPLEWVGETISIKEKMIDDKMSAETAEEEVVQLDFSIEYSPTDVIRFLSFSQQQLEEAIKHRVKSIISIAVRKRKDRDEVYDQLEEIASEVTSEFASRHSVQYGVRVRFLIDDPEMPPKLVEAEVGREIQEKENERRKLEVAAMTDLAKYIMEQSRPAKDKEPTITLQEAMKAAQVQLKIVPETRQIFDVGNNIVGAIKIAPELARSVLERFSSTKVKSRKSKK